MFLYLYKNSKSRVLQINLLLILDEQSPDEVLGIFRDVHEGFLVELPVAGLHVLQGLDVVVTRERR